MMRLHALHVLSCCENMKGKAVGFGEDVSKDMCGCVASKRGTSSGVSYTA